MGKFLAAVGLLLLAGMMFFHWYNSDEQQSARAEQRYIAAQREALNLEADQQWADMRAATAPAIHLALTIAQVVLILAIPTSAILGGVALFARFRVVHRLVKPDSAGLLPARVDDLAELAPAALAGFHRARLAAASRPVLPAHLTYAPHDTRRVDAGVLPDPDQGKLGAVSTPAFRELLAAGKIGQGQPLVLGFDAETGAELPGSWLDLFSVGIGGLSGSGKSWTGAFLVSQAMLHGSRIALLDPHCGDPESISTRLQPFERTGRYLCSVASGPRDMLAAVAMVRDELERRKTSGRKGEPWIIVADEFTSLMRGDLADPLAGLFEAIAQEGRKLHIFGMALGQIWSGSRAGGTEVRDSLASAYIHRLRPAQARMLSGISADELPGDVLGLPTGSAYFLSTRGEMRRVTIPRMTPDDLESVARQITGAAVESTGTNRRMGFRPATQRVHDEYSDGPPAPADGDARTRPVHVAYTSDATCTSAAASPKPVDAEVACILAAFRAGKTVHDLAAEMAGSTNTNSRAYREARAKVEEILRLHLAA